MTTESDEIKLWDSEIRRLIANGEPLPLKLAEKLPMQYEVGLDMRQEMANEREEYYTIMKAAISWFLKSGVSKRPSWVNHALTTLNEGGEEMCLNCAMEPVACKCTGGPMLEVECTCYEGPGHQMGCAFYGRSSEIKRETK